MNIEQMSDRKLELERHMIQGWVLHAIPEEYESGEVGFWKKGIEKVDAEIERRQEQGSETR
jgi:hypothetical protein